LRIPPHATLFPFTTLFRSGSGWTHVPHPAAVLQPLFDKTLDQRQRGIQLRGIGAAALGHVRTTAALAADGRGRLLHQLAGLELRSEEHTSELQSRENLVCR